MTGRDTLRAACAALAVAIGASVALAKAPAPVPTIEEVRVRAAQAEEQRKAREIAAAADPVRDACEAYAAKRAKLAEWKPLTDVLLDEKETDDHRKLAKDSLIARFKAENVQGDVVVRRERKAIALTIGHLLAANKNDDSGLKYAEEIFREWYIQKLLGSGWKPERSKRDRERSWKSLEKDIKRDDP